MSDASKPAASSPMPLIEKWSAISQGDLGFKAVYWADDTKTTLIARPILGWMTYDSRRADSTIPTHGFVPLVMGDHWLPVMVGVPPRHHCVAPKDATDEQILAKFPAAGPPTPQGVGGVFH